MIDLFSVLFLFSSCKMTNPCTGVFHAKIQYKIKRPFFLYTYMCCTICAFFCTFCTSADTVCDFKGLILSTTFHAVHRKKKVLNI